MLSISFLALLLRLGVALLLGAFIGLERESTEHAAGMRTNALVAMGSCFFMIISIYGFSDFINIPHVQLDPSRIASYVVAGIGFLGAGSIFRSQNGERVKGLTTAATIWLVAAIGLACGTGLLLEAVTATALTLAVLILLRLVERVFPPTRAAFIHPIRLEVEPVESGQLLGRVYDTCTGLGAVVETLAIDREQEKEIVRVSCRTRDGAVLARVIGELRSLPGVRAVHADLRGVQIEVPKSEGKSS